MASSPFAKKPLLGAKGSISSEHTSTHWARCFLYRRETSGIGFGSARQVIVSISKPSARAGSWRENIGFRIFAVGLTGMRKKSNAADLEFGRMMRSSSTKRMPEYVR